MSLRRRRISSASGSAVGVAFASARPSEARVFGDAGVTPRTVRFSRESRARGFFRREIADQTLVLADGIIGAADLAVAFAESEHGGGGEGALGVDLGHDLFVATNGGGQVAAGFLGEDGGLEGLVERLAGGRVGARGRRGQEDQEHEKQERFHAPFLSRYRRRFVRDL
jgi:hypothetical protein